MSLSKSEFFAAAAKTAGCVPVEVEGIGTVYVRKMTLGERDEYEQSRVEKIGDEYEVTMTNARARLVVLCACDQDGKRIFTDEDISALAAMPAPTLEPIVDKAMELNRMRPKDVKDLAKNSGPTQNGVSSST